MSLYMHIYDQCAYVCLALLALVKQCSMGIPPVPACLLACMLSYMQQPYHGIPSYFYNSNSSVLSAAGYLLYIILSSGIFIINISLARHTNFLAIANYFLLVLNLSLLISLIHLAIILY